MTLEDAIVSARKKRDTYLMNVHILKEDDSEEYFSVIEINLDVFKRNLKDSKIYHTLWNMKR